MTPRPSTGGEQRWLQPGDHHPAQTRLDDEVGARVGPGGTGGARLERAVQRRPAPAVAPASGSAAQPGQRGLLGVVHGFSSREYPVASTDPSSATIRRRPRTRSVTAGTAVTARSPAKPVPVRLGRGAGPPPAPPRLAPGSRDGSRGPARPRRAPPRPLAPLAPCPSAPPSRYLSRTMPSRRRTSARRIGRPGPCGYSAGPANRGAAAAPTKNGATASSSSSTSPSTRNWRPSPRPALDQQAAHPAAAPGR